LFPHRKFFNVDRRDVALWRFVQTELVSEGLRSINVRILVRESGLVLACIHTHTRTLLAYGRCLVWISAEALVNLTDFRDFLSHSRKVSGQHFKLRHVCFLPNFVQFIIHWPPHRSTLLRLSRHCRNTALK